MQVHSVFFKAFPLLFVTHAFTWEHLGTHKGEAKIMQQSLALAHAQGNRIGFCYIVGKAGAVPYRVSVFFRGVFPQDRFNLGQFFR